MLGRFLGDQKGEPRGCSFASRTLRIIEVCSANPRLRHPFCFLELRIYEGSRFALLLESTLWFKFVGEEKAVALKVGPDLFFILGLLRLFFDHCR